ncbi:MAG: dual specificity protein phosphatase family protein [Gammaproteobacteria bacterium]
MKKYKYLLIVLLFCNSVAFAEPRLRPSDWSAPVIGISLDNLYQVDKGVFRSEQPDTKSFIELERFGLKEVLNLRKYHSDDDEASKTKLKLHRIKMDAGSITEAQITAALKIIKNRKGPILVHCWHGSDRTGAVIASYRVIFNNWSKEKAIDEMRNGGFGYHAKIYPNVVTLIKNLNVKKIKSKLGVN